MFYTWTLSPFYGPFHIFICFVENRLLLSELEGHWSQVTIQLPTFWQTNQETGETHFHSLRSRTFHTLSKRLTLLCVKLPFQSLFCMWLEWRQHLHCKIQFSAWGLFQTTASSYVAHASSCIWVLSNILSNDPRMKSHFCRSQQ